MSKASKAIALLLVPLSVIFLGFHDCENGDSYPTTRSTSGGGSHSSFFGRSSSYNRSGYSGSHSSFSSGTSRGGFGSHGGSFGS